MLDPISNLFLIGCQHTLPLQRSHWYGVEEGERVVAVVLVVPGRLVVPFASDPALARELGRELTRRGHRPCMLVGPREAADALWSAWAPSVQPVRWHDQRLMVCDAPLDGESVEGFRRARAEDAPTVWRLSAAMETEDIGRRPLEDDPMGFVANVRRRIEEGHTWVIERNGEIVFLIHVGTVTSFGVQVGGTYVTPAARGQGLAKAGMQELGRRLLTRHPCITLHVHDRNTPAVRAYLASGYRDHAPFRLVTVQGAP